MKEKEAKRNEGRRGNVKRIRKGEAEREKQTERDKERMKLCPTKASFINIMIRKSHI